MTEPEVSVPIPSPIPFFSPGDLKIGGLPLSEDSEHLSKWEEMLRLFSVSLGLEVGGDTSDKVSLTSP